MPKQSLSGLNVDNQSLGTFSNAVEHTTRYDRQCSSAWKLKPYRLLSLLDMLPVNLKDFLVTFGVVENMMCQCSTFEDFSKLGHPIPPDEFDQMRRRIRNLKERCKELGLNTSSELIANTLATYMPDGLITPYGELRKSLDSIVRTIYAELRQVMLMHIPPASAERFDQPALFGQPVADKFSDAAYDISEAGSCYATGRHTACVMHLMRGLEVAISALGRGIGLPNVVVDAKQSWTRALKNIGDQIGQNDKGTDPLWPSKSQFFKDARAHLFAVKVAWRDTAMHLEKSYGPREADRIYRAAKDLMEHLAEHLDQSGAFTP